MEHKHFDSYGHFDETRGCFVLTAEPPRKWWNLHCTAINNDGPEMYAEVAHINDGPTWIRDADGTTVSMVGYDQKYHYIRDDETNEVFCPAGQPAPLDVTNKIVEFHREKTVMQSECIGLRATQRVFVPQHLPIECTTIEIENLSAKTREISVFSYALFQLTGMNKEGRGIWKTNFSEVHPEIGGVYVVNRNTDVPTDRFKGYLIALENFHNANGYRDHFTRADYSVSAPQILWGWNCDGRPGYGPDCAGIVQVKLSIPPHSSARADFVLGQTANLEEIKTLRKSLSPAKLDAWCESARQIEADRANAFKVDVGHPLYNGLFNIFLKKPALYLFNQLKADFGTICKPTSPWPWRILPPPKRTLSAPWPVNTPMAPCHTAFVRSTV